MGPITGEDYRGRESLTLDRGAGDFNPGQGRPYLLIGARLKKAREDMGVSQLSLSVELGFTTEVLISRIERGLCGLSPKHFYKAARFLGIEIQELIDLHVECERQRISKIVWGAKCP